MGKATLLQGNQVSDHFKDVPSEVLTRILNSGALKLVASMNPDNWDDLWLRRALGMNPPTIELSEEPVPEGGYRVKPEAFELWHDHPVSGKHFLPLDFFVGDLAFMTADECARSARINSGRYTGQQLAESFLEQLQRMPHHMQMRLARWKYVFPATQYVFSVAMHRLSKDASFIYLPVVESVPEWKIDLESLGNIDEERDKYRLFLRSQ